MKKVLTGIVANEQPQTSYPYGEGKCHYPINVEEVENAETGETEYKYDLVQEVETPVTKKTLLAAVLTEDEKAYVLAHIDDADDPMVAGYKEIKKTIESLDIE